MARPSNIRQRVIAATLLMGLVLGLALVTRRTGACGRSSEVAGSRLAASVGSTGEDFTDPADLGARGSGDAGSTPSLASRPSEEDGVLEVEVLSGTTPVPGASARLYWRGPRDPNLNALSWRLASTGTTDARGLVRLPSRPGSYLVALRAEGFATVRKDVIRPHGEARTPLRVLLGPAQSLSGQTVEKDSREPLPLVELILTPHGRKLEPWQDAEAPAEERVYATSDERGGFHVEGLATGAYTLEARAPGHTRALMTGVKVPDGEPLTVALSAAGVIEGFVVDAQGRPVEGAEVQIGGSEAQSVTTGTGGGFAVEVEAGDYLVSARHGEEAGALERPLTVSAGRQVRNIQLKLGEGAVLEGRVVSAAHQMPIAGARVDISPFGKSGDSGRAVTDESGGFSVGGLAPGSYDVVTSAPGFSTLSRRGVTVLEGERFALELPLTTTGAAEGQVTDGDGRPVAGVRVTAGNAWSSVLGRSVAESRTDAEGHYRMEGLDIGKVYLTARREGASAGVSLPVEVSEGGTARRDFILKETGTLEGRVRATRGALPSGKLAVTAFFDEPDVAGPPGVGQTEVGPDGTFELTLSPGNYLVYVASMEHEGSGLRGSKRVRVETGRAAQVELIWMSEEPAEEVLQGVVVEADGTPSPMAFVSLDSGESGWRSRTEGVVASDRGRFSIPLPAGAGAVTVSARNGGRLGGPVNVPQGVRELVIPLRSGATVRGHVVRASGDRPVRGLTVSFYTERRDGFPTDENTWEFPGDRFELRDVPATPLALIVRTKDGARGDVHVAPEAGAVTQVEVTLKATSGVRGRVVEESTRKPRAEAHVIVAMSNTVSASETTGPDGRFSFDDLSPGEHVLLVMTGPTMTPERRALTLEEGQRLDLGDILLRPPHVDPGTLGMYLRREGPAIEVGTVTPEGPAARAGIREGDVLVAVDGDPVTDLRDAYKRTAGAPGSAVVLTIRRSGTEQSVSATRAP